MSQGAVVEADLRAAAAAAHPDAFISYAREDGATAQWLTDALEARGRALWIDLADVPFAADWRARARAGIDAAKAVVFVLSEHWVASQACRFELEHAVAARKRLVTLSLDPDLDAERLPAALRDLSWIPVGGDRDRTLAALVATLDEDLAWRDAHARLTVRAVDWDAKGRDRSQLLRGTELREAEGWLERQDEHAETATPLHGAYIAASRRAASRRQRTVLLLVAAALLVSLTLGALAYWQRGIARDNEREAVAQRRVAVENAREARSRELAATATVQLAEDPELALLIAVEAARAAPTAQAEEALRAALPRTTAARALPHPGLQDVALDRDGTVAVTGGTDGLARLWDLGTGRRRAVLRGHSDQQQSDVAHGVTDVALGEDGSVAATAGAEGQARVWDARRGRLLHTLQAGALGFTDVAVSARAGVVVTGGQDGTVRTWSIRTGELRGAVRLPESEVIELQVSPDGRRVAAAALPHLDGEGLVGVWDAASLDPLARLRTTAFEVAFSHDGRTLATVGSRSVALWRTEGGGLVRRVPVAGELPATVAWSPAGPAAVTTRPGVVTVLDAATGTAARSVAHPGRVSAVSFSADGRSVLTTGTDGTARLWDAATGRRLVVLRGHRSPVWFAAFLGARGQVLTAGADGRARIWRPRPSQRARELRGHGAVVEDLAVAPRGDVAVTTSADGTARIWDLRSGRRRATVDHGNGADGASATLDPTGRTLLTAGWRTARLWDAVTGRPRASLPGDAGGDATLSADGRFVVARSGRVWDARTGRPGRRLPEFFLGPLPIRRGSDAGVLGTSADGTVAVRELPSGRPLVRLEGTGGSGVLGAAATPDGSLLAVAQEGAVGLWDGRTGRRLARLPGATDVLPGAAFDRHGTRLLTETGTGIRIWDVRRRRPLADLPHPRPLGSAAFSADGRLVVTAAFDGLARIWEVRTGRRIAALRGRTREMWSEGFVPQAAIGPDGRTVVAATGGSTAFVHECALCASLPGLLEQAARATGRRLTTDERLTHLGG